MKETIQLRVNLDHAHLLFDKTEGKTIGSSVKIITISPEDTRYKQISKVSEHIKKEYQKPFFFGWQIDRKYTKTELKAAKLFRILIKSKFEPSGEECGTIYDESTSCPICGSNRKQLSLLKLNYKSVPKKDISKTIGGEIVVSDKFYKLYNAKGLLGAVFKPISFTTGESGYYQLTAKADLELSDKTVAGIDPFDLSTENEGEVYKCPRSHTIGLNILSELYLKDNPEIDLDFYSTKQRVGVKRGLLRPEPLYLCSSKLRNLIIQEKLTGFEFEIAHVNS